jgi:phosphoenolpyruvate carboxykinase (ATP)
VSKLAGDDIVDAKEVAHNPSLGELRAMAAAMPNARWTEFGNVNVQTKVVARSKASTYVVTDHPEQHTDQTISREEGARIAGIQDDFIRGAKMVVIDGYIGPGSERVAARLIIEEANANIAGMQRQLYYVDRVGPGFEPDVTVIYTPNLTLPGYPNDRMIAVDLDNNVTRVINSDYFGESKKGGLRMWNKIIFDQGGLALHAGCKLIPVDGGQKTGLIVGLSGTGKTTTTFTKQNGSLPVQDDFVALMPGGKVLATENGCFAKTFGLDPRYEPTIHGAVTSPAAFLENVSMDEQGKLDFFDTSYTQNGRATFEFSAIDAASPSSLGAADFLLILNRNENIIPAVARLSQEQAAAYFMLGETQGTSAGGAEEAGKFLRVAGTNPFFPLRYEQMGNRFLSLLTARPMPVYLMNTGRVGGGDDDERSKKVKIPHSSAVVKAIAEGTASWTEDPDFGYRVAESLPDIDDIELLQPRRLYERQGRMSEYRAMVDRLRLERRAYLAEYPGLEPEIIAAI